MAEHFFERKRNEVGVSLNEVQRRAVQRTEGPLLLLASPGSGKTTTIIMRIGYLLEEKGVDPSRLKAVTFSRASAGDMKERFKRFFPGLPPDCVDFSTIHSLAFEIARDHFRRTGTAYRLIEGELQPETEQAAADSITLPVPVLHKKIILRELYERITRNRLTDDQMEELTTYISYVKNKLIPQEKWASVKCDVPDAERVLREYETFKRTGTDKLLIDYDDMLVIGHEALERDKALLGKYQRRYDYVLTDESQDTSLVQHAIIEKLVRAHGNLCVVADDDQSIYGWRAAEPQYLLDFKRTYPRAAILKMTQNYRSTKAIVGAANRFIKRNKNRYDKTMFTENESGKPIVIRSLSDYKYQAKYVAEQISGVEHLREVAVLYRNNSSSIALMNVLDKSGIPFYMKDGDNRFFSHWVVEDILNFMRLTYTDKRPELFESIHTKCIGYVTRQQMAAVRDIRNNESVFDNLIAYGELKDYQVKQLLEAKETFANMRGAAPLEAIRTISGKLGYEKAIDKMCERLGFRKEYLIGIVNALEEIAEGLATMEEFANRLKHLEQAMKSSRHNKGTNAVTLSTFHSAKGLEFERVYMIDLIEGIIPSNDDIKKFEGGEPANMEEAVRLFYVGMTRAKSHLELLAYRWRDGAKTKESRFMEHIRKLQAPAPSDRQGAPQKAASRSPSQTPAPASAARRAEPARPAKRPLSEESRQTIARLKQTGKAFHRSFGSGEIVYMDDETIHIRFEKGLKKLLLTVCVETGLLRPVSG
ncbi:ATP-dependent helicase [Paenibacillus ginsengarvi]|uniref:DNA 3'-5' helicase n=1 Tax=Paenibacillus ginsengarvi TaxID=400777 RepID=A0A3B0BXQ7_9BACL|nr:ATP-dependent helicase [Paenibacillus ginsengarvi]RKN78253.1 ATP-dependent helicase [Paenibacillus ginsengarvi]